MANIHLKKVVSNVFSKKVTFYFKKWSQIIFIKVWVANAFRNIIFNCIKWSLCTCSVLSGSLSALISNHSAVRCAVRRPHAPILSLTCLPCSLFPSPCCLMYNFKSFSYNSRNEISLRVSSSPELLHYSFQISFSFVLTLFLLFFTPSFASSSPSPPNLFFINASPSPLTHYLFPWIHSWGGNPWDVGWV